MSLVTIGDIWVLLLLEMKVVYFLVSTFITTIKLEMKNGTVFSLVPNVMLAREVAIPHKLKI
jgi:hypothetical protein